MKNWAKIIETESTDFLVLLNKEENSFSIRFPYQDNLFEAEYEPRKNSNANCEKIFEDEKELSKICLNLIEETIRHYDT